jgi:CRP-like cAMP-binding protein
MPEKPFNPPNLPMELSNLIVYGGLNGSSATQRPRLPARQESALDLTSRPPNGFLSALTAEDFELIRPYLRTVDLLPESTLVGVGGTLWRAYMPHRGVTSLVVNLAKGEHVQVAMIGRDSILGVFSTLGDPVALTNALVLVPGTTSTIELDRLRAAADQSATLRALMMRHGLAMYAQVQQTAGCNASHSVEARLARCLLQIHDLSGSCKLVLTQESIAQMIGARRNSVSLVASTLQQAEVIHYSRGHIQILDLDALKKAACECYRTVKTQYERLLGPHRHDTAQTKAPSMRDKSQSGTV